MLSRTREFQVSSAPITMRLWIGNVYKGIEEYFPPPEFVSVQRVTLVACWKVLDRDRRRFEAVWGSIFAAFLKRSGNEMARIYGSTRTDAFVDSYVRREFTPALQQHYRKLYGDVGGYFLGQSPRAIRKADPFEVVDPYQIPEFSNWIARTTGQKIKNVSQATIDRVKVIIDEGIRDAEAIPDIVDRIRRAGVFSEARGYRIARTEVISASNAATHFGVARNVDTEGMTKTWLSTGDHRTRETHRRANNQEQSYNDPFQVGSSELLFPGDSSLGASAKELVQCRCSCLYNMARR